MSKINVDLENIFHLLVDIILIKVKDLSHLSIYFLLKKCFIIFKCINLLFHSMVIFHVI